MEENMLAHYGVKGMKWGVRRYQNKDGSLTNAGKKRYSNEIGSAQPKKKINIEKVFDQNIKTGKDKSPISAAEKVTKESQKVIDNATQISNTISKIRKKDNKSDPMKSMSNEELKAAIDRMRLEDSYQELSTKRVDEGKKKVSDILSMTGNAVGIVASVAGIVATVHNLRK